MRSAFLQILAVLTVVSLFSYLAILMDFNSKLNLVWLVGLPVLVALVANRPLIHRIVMTVALLAGSVAAFFTTMVATGAA